jgi:hypothetical protein
VQVGTNSTHYLANQKQEGVNKYDLIVPGLLQGSYLMHVSLFFLGKISPKSDGQKWLAKFIKRFLKK